MLKTLLILGQLIIVTLTTLNPYQTRRVTLIGTFKVSQPAEAFQSLLQNEHLRADFRCSLGSCALPKVKTYLGLKPNVGACMISR